MKILVTGSNGLLGQKLVQLIQTKSECQLIATSRGKNRLKNLSSAVIYESMDISNSDEVERIFLKHKPDTVIHTAAMTQVDDCELNQADCWTMNVNAVQHVVNSCKAINAFLIHVSTDFIFDGKDGPYDENATPNPVSHYGKSKLAAEEIVKTGKLRWAIARTVLVYGIAADMSRSNIILWVKKNLEEKKQIKVVDDQWRTPTLAEDLALGCFLIAEKKAPGIFNISGKDFLTPYEMALKTADFFKLDRSFITRADASIFTQPARRPPKTGFIIDKARNQLGYEPHSFEEGIRIVEAQLQLR